jgi:hypothetical protein
MGPTVLVAQKPTISKSFMDPSLPIHLRPRSPIPRDGWSLSDPMWIWPGEGGYDGKNNGGSEENKGNRAAPRETCSFHYQETQEQYT